MLTAVRTIDDALLRGWPLPIPDHGDKNARGAVVVAGGAPQMPGAVVLAATAALRAGAGKLQIATAASVAAHVAIAVPEALVAGLEETSSGALARATAAALAERANAADALVFGPGLVDEDASARLAVDVAAALQVPAVFDAAALGCVTECPDALGPNGRRCVLTPHPGEMAAIAGANRDDVERDPVRFAREGAARYGATVVLKGAQTFVATPDGELFCNRAGHIGLATSGSGDVLAGIIGGLLARGAPPHHAACWGVALHARAGAVLARRIGMGFLARELPAEIPPLMAAIGRP